MSDKVFIWLCWIILFGISSLAEEVSENLSIENNTQDNLDESILPVQVNETIPETDEPAANESEIVVTDDAADSNVNSSQAENTTELNSNSTSTGLPKWHCKGRNVSEGHESFQRVLIVDADELLQWVNTSTDNDSDACAVVLFYTRYCPFCAKLAPLYNAFGRVFGNLPVLAIDAYKHHSLNTRFGVVAVPTILLFHSGKPVLKFNNSFSLDDLRIFVKNNTGIEGNYTIQISQEDSEGPLPSIPTEERDNYLVFSVLFLLVFGCFMFVKSSYGQLVWDRVQGIQWERILQWFRRDKQD